MTTFTTPFGPGALQLAHPKHRVRALFHGHLLADTEAAVLVRQAGQPDRVYFPRESVEMEALVATQAVGAGQARVFTIYRDATVTENAAWSFEAPDAGAEELSGMITFDPALVSIEQEAAQDALWDAEAAKMSEYIRHTDSGSGRSQDEPWPANVSVPGDLLGEDEQKDEAPVNVRPTP